MELISQLIFLVNRILFFSFIDLACQNFNFFYIISMELAILYFYSHCPCRNITFFLYCYGCLSI